MRSPIVSRLTPMIVLAASGLALAACAGGPADPHQQALDAMYNVGQNNAFGAGQDADSLRAAAQPAATAPLTAEQQKTLDGDFHVGQNNAFGATHSTDAIMAQRDYGRLAATVPMVGGKRDLVGDGGAQDAMAKEMYPLGTSVDDFGGHN